MSLPRQNGLIHIGTRSQDSVHGSVHRYQSLSARESFEPPIQVLKITSEAFGHKNSETRGPFARRRVGVCRWVGVHVPSESARLLSMPKHPESMNICGSAVRVVLSSSRARTTPVTLGCATAGNLSGRTPPVTMTIDGANGAKKASMLCGVEGLDAELP